MSATFVAYFHSVRAHNEMTIDICSHSLVFLGETSRLGSLVFAIGCVHRHRDDDVDDARQRRWQCGGHRENCVKMPVAFAVPSDFLRMRRSTNNRLQGTHRPLCYVLCVDNAMVLFGKRSTHRTEYMACDALPVWPEHDQHSTDTEHSQTVISHFHKFSSIRAERKVSSGVSVHDT